MVSHKTNSEDLKFLVSIFFFRRTSWKKIIPTYAKAANKGIGKKFNFSEILESSPESSPPKRTRSLRKIRFKISSKKTNFSNCKTSIGEVIGRHKLGSY
jgi:hypothetical protein